MNLKTKSILPIVAIAIIVIGVAVFLSESKNTVNELRVADPGAIGWAPYYVAIDRGMFDKQGIKVIDIPVQTGDEALKAVMSGSADVAFAGILPYSFAAYEHPELKIFAQTGAAHDAQIISNSDRGIKNPSDLKGKKIGYAKNTASDMEVNKFLASNGMTVNDVTLVAVKPLAMITALASGQIDAYSAWEPHIMNVKKAFGDKFVIFNGEENTYTWHPAVIADGKYISQNKSDLVKFMKAWKEAQEYIKGNPDESIAITAKYAKVAPEDLKSAWNKYDFFLTSGDEAVSALNTDLSFANSRREKPANTALSANDLIDQSILNAIKK